MSHIWVVIRLAFRLSNILHDLVLTFTGNFVTGKDDFASLPVNVFTDFLRNEILQLLRKPSHKFSTRRDTIRIERIFLWQLLPFSDRFLSRLLCVQGSSESPRPLLVHLRTRGHAINCHEEQLLRLYLAEEVLDIVEDLDEHLILANMLGDAGIIVIVGAVVDDAIHIKIEAVKLRNAVFSDKLRDGWVSLR